MCATSKALTKGNDSFSKGKAFCFIHGQGVALRSFPEMCLG